MRNCKLYLIAQYQASLAEIGRNVVIKKPKKLKKLMNKPTT